MDITLQAIAEAFFTIFSVEAVRYGVAIALVAFLIHKIARSDKSRHLHLEPASKAQKRHEFFYSMVTCAVFSANGLYINFGIEGGWVQIYEDASLYGLLYIPICWVGMVVAHDAYFYWAHRLLHRRLMFRWAHHIHHKSHRPTAWAAYSFSPAEAFINGSFVPLWVTFVPTYGWVAFLFLAHMILRNAMGHSGYELFPVKMPGNKFWGFLTNVFHHDLHHRDIERGNFGLYFVWWDRWMGTEHPEYTALVDDQRSNPSEVPAT